MAFYPYASFSSNSLVNKLNDLGAEFKQAVDVDRFRVFLEKACHLNDDIAEKLTTWLDTWIQSNEVNLGTGLDAEMDKAFSDDPESFAINGLESQQAPRSKFLIMQYLSDSLTETVYQNDPSRIPIVTNGDWQIASSSFVGTHTYGVNADAVRVPSAPSPLLAVIADGVSLPLTSQQVKAYKKALTVDEESDCDVFSAAKIQRDVKETYSSHYLANELVRAVTEVNISPYVSSISSNLLNTTNLQLSERNEDTLDKIKGKPLVFLAELFQALAETGNVRPDQFFGDIFALKSDNLERQYPGYKTLLSDVDLRRTLVALIPLYYSQDLVKNKMQQIYSNYPDELAAMSTIVYALDLGDHVALVSMGDSYAFALPSDTYGDLIQAAPARVKDGFYDVYLSGDNPTAGSPRHLNANQNISLGTNIGVKILEKKDFKSLVLCTDGRFTVDPSDHKSTFEENSSAIGDMFLEQDYSSPQAMMAGIIKASQLKQYRGFDDRSCVVISRICT